MKISELPAILQEMGWEENKRLDGGQKPNDSIMSWIHWNESKDPNLWNQLHFAKDISQAPAAKKYLPSDEVIDNFQIY